MILHKEFMYPSTRCVDQKWRSIPSWKARDMYGWRMKRTVRTNKTRSSKFFRNPTSKLVSPGDYERNSKGSFTVHPSPKQRSILNFGWVVWKRWLSRKWLRLPTGFSDTLTESVMHFVTNSPMPKQNEWTAKSKKSKPSEEDTEDLKISESQFYSSAVGWISIHNIRGRAWIWFYDDSYVY